MTFTHSDLYNSPNKLADFYSMFKVKERILLTGHSHQAWPDCGFEGQKKAWEDAAFYVDEKWEKAFQKAEEVKRGYLKLLGDDSGYITLAASTHELVIKFLSALPLRTKPKLVTTDGEFHSIRRQLDRLNKEGIEVEKVPSYPVYNVVDNLKNQCDEKTSAVLVSSVFFNSGLILPGLKDLAEHCESKGINLLVDTYHNLNIAPFSVKENKLENAFITGGGYKYCQLGEGNCFLRSPEDNNLRPVITGWYSEFTALSDKKKPGEVLYGTGGDKFAGATYDPTSNYRAAEVFGFFKDLELTPEFLREVSQHQISLLASEFDKLDPNPAIIKRDKSVDIKQIAGFLVLYSESAGEISKKLRERNVWTDYRGNVLRLGPAPYLSDNQIKDAVKILGEMINNSTF
jgi:kynureninase